MELKEFQKKIIKEAKERWGIFADTGCGKTAICLALANNHASSALVITTKSLKKNWEMEKKMWVKRNIEIFIMSKEEFRRDYAKLPAFNAVIFDEFHFFGNYKSQLHKAAKSYLKTHNPMYVWGATATPILSSVMSVWALSCLLGRPLGSFISFQLKYFSQVRMHGRMIPVQKKNIEKSIAEDLRKIGTVISKDEALDLPEFTHEFEWFQLTAEQKKAIKKLDEDPTTIMPIVLYTKTLQIVNGTLKTGEDTYEEIRSEKVSRLLELVDQHPSCVIVCRQTAELRMLHDKIPGSMIYDGNTSVEERDEIIKKVNKGLGIMLLQADMGIGFNLTGISVMIFYSSSWDYVKYYQCLGRIHRMGQTKKCVYIHLITENTIDEGVWRCLERKESFDVELYNR